MTTFPLDLLDHARDARGFMPHDEGLALFEEARLRAPAGPLMEVGTWCGKSAIYLAAAARESLTDPAGRVITLDHHRGSEENQPGWEYHDPDLVDPRAGRIDTLPFFRATMTHAGLEDVVIAIVGRSPSVAAWWATPLSLLFVDGGHTDEHVTSDVVGFGRWVMPGGSLVFHDVFARPEDGGQAPWRCYRRVLDGGDVTQTGVCGSMRILRRERGAVGTPLTLAETAA